MEGRLLIAAQPRALLATSALCVILAPALVARGAPEIAALLVAAALVPWSPRYRAAGLWIAYPGAAWCLWSAFRVPLGARAGVLVMAAALLFARVWALRSAIHEEGGRHPRGGSER